MPSSLGFVATKKPIVSRCLALLICSVTLPAIASAQVLTADEAVRLALENTPNRVFIDAPSQMAQGAVISAETWRNPVLSVEREGERGFGGDRVETTVSLERAFDFSGRRSLHADGARADLVAARAQGFVTQADLQADTLGAFYGVLAAQAELEAAERLREQFVSLEAATLQRVEAGDASRFELERVRQETLVLPGFVSEAQLNMQGARDELFIATGSERALSARIEGDLLPGTEGLATLGGANIPARLAVLEAGVEAAAARETAASRLAPEVNLGLGVRHAAGMGAETGVVVSASLPLPLFDRNQGERLARAADARLAEARLRREQRRIEAEAGALRRRAAVLHQTATDYEADALVSAREMQRIALVSYQSGEISVLEAIDALRAAFDAETRAISLKFRARQAEIALNALLAETE